LDVSGFSNAIRALLDDSKLRTKIGRAAQKRVKEKFTWEACADQTIAVHKSLLEKRKRKSLGILLNSGDSFEAMKREGQEDRFRNHYIPRWKNVFDDITIFSYATKTPDLGDAVRVVPKTSNLKGQLYSLLMPFVQWEKFKRIDLLRVMQVQGAGAAVMARIIKGIPFVATYGYRYGDSMRLKGRHTYGLWLDFLESIALRLAKKVIVTTPSLQAHVQRITHPSKIHMIPNGVDTTAFSPGPASKRKSIRVLFVGRLEAHKNLPMVISSLASIRTIPVELWVVGEGPQKNHWLEMCEELELAHRFLGTIPHSKLPDIHRQVDVFVLPSLFEGHPKVLIEAFASGLACVGTKAPGIVDVIKDGDTGLIAKPTVSGFGEQLVRVITDKDLRNRLGENARAFAVENYDLEKLLDREQSLLRSFVQEEPSR
jgi:glycosyltransferase involved in cell wall biosynthesis